MFAKPRLLGLSPVALLGWAILAIVPLFVKNTYVIYLMTFSLLLGSQAMAFDFSVGFINIVNFGFAGFVGLGAYTSGLLATKLGISPWISMWAGALAGGLLGLLIGALTLRLRGLYAAVMAWFATLTLMAVTTAWVSLTRGNYGLSVVSLFKSVDIQPYYYTLLPISFGIYVLLHGITRSHIGLAFRAIGQNLGAAQASGVDPARYKIINFMVSCACAGLLGAFHAHWVGTITPSLMNSPHTIEVLALAYIGGRGSIWGGLVAALMIIPTFENLRSLLEMRLIIYGALLILVMIFYPSGLAGIFRQIGHLVTRLRKGTTEKE